MKQLKKKSDKFYSDVKLYYILNTIKLIMKHNKKQHEMFNHKAMNGDEYGKHKVVKGAISTE